MGSLVDIADELARRRRALGLSQADLAARLGVKRQQVQRWEAQGYRTASLERVARVAEALGVEANDPHLEHAAEARTAYRAGAPGLEGIPGPPVRDLGEVVSRIRRHAAELHRRFGVTSIDVFGSFARGEQRPDSDVDLIVEVAHPGLRTVMGAEQALTLILGRRAETGPLDSLDPRIRGRADRERVHVWSA